VEALGSNTLRKVDVRIIAATSQDLEANVADKSFRADLYYRIAVLTVRIPPLRERREDIAVLCETLLEQVMRPPGQRGWVLLPEAIRRLEAHDWPGNVRELRNVLERAAALAPSEVLDAAAVRRAMPQSAPRLPTSPAPAGGGDLATRLAEAERDAILAALDASNGEKLAAARRLGVSRSQFYDKLKRHKITS
jgi:DNA-binding NtrC family response regulator